MTKKLSKDQLEKKAKHHKTKAKFYQKKVEEVKEKESRVGFKWFD